MPLSSRCWAMNSRSVDFLSVGFRTRKNRFSRLKPVTAISGSWSFKWHRISSRTAGVAVAVKAASTGRVGSDATNGAMFI